MLPEQQLQTVAQELNDLEYLLAEKLVQKSRVLTLQRERSRLEGHNWPLHDR